MSINFIHDNRKEQNRRERTRSTSDALIQEMQNNAKMRKILITTLSENGRFGPSWAALDRNCPRYQYWWGNYPSTKKFLPKKQFSKWLKNWDRFRRKIISKIQDPIIRPRYSIIKAKIIIWDFLWFFLTKFVSSFGGGSQIRNFRTRISNQFFQMIIFRKWHGESRVQDPKIRPVITYIKMTTKKISTTLE